MARNVAVLTKIIDTMRENPEFGCYRCKYFQKECPKDTRTGERYCIMWSRDTVNFNDFFKNAFKVIPFVCGDDYE